MAPDITAAVREILERERALQRELVGRAFAPSDAIFALLEESAAALRQPAELAKTVTGAPRSRPPRSKPRKRS